MTGPPKVLDEEAILAEFRSWLDANRPADPRALDRHVPLVQRALAAREWEARLGRAGWLGVTWPVEYGGRGWPVRTAALLAREMVRAGLPELFNQVGLDLVGPAIVLHGTEAQKQRFLPAILAGEVWCQGFSEPDAGSDLASLRTRADADGDRFVLNGQKVWSSFASAADHAIVLARTNPDAPKHRGISCFLVPMTTPGIELRPIRQITGDAEFFELFFDDCSVGADQLLGPLGGGWRVAMDVLANERTGIFSLLGTVHSDLLGMLELVRALPPASPVRDELEVRATELAIRERIIQWKSDRAVEHLQGDDAAPALDATMKVSWSELHELVADVAVEAAGAQGILEPEDPDVIERGRWLFALLQSRAETIYAGTSEIQRNIIAERVLGLPRHDGHDERAREHAATGGIRRVPRREEDTI